MSNETDRATLRPWELHDEEPERQAIEIHPLNDECGDSPIADVLGECVGMDAARANAALIVAAVNSYDAMREACEAALRDYETMNETYRNEAICERLRAALALAEK